LLIECFARRPDWNSFPRSGRVVPEVGRDAIREIIVQHYRVVYRLRTNEVEILTVHHGARLLRELDG
jgi:plasmid stabilization system protein ParE